MRILKLVSFAALSMVLAWLIALIFLPLTYAQTTPPTPNNQTNVTPSSNQVGIDISGFAFVPASLTIPVGTTVTWTNKDATNHTVTSDVGSFDSGALAQNATFSFTFNTPGTYTYHCNIHPGMMGTIIVAKTVDISGFAFNPTPLTIPVGTTVLWTNKDAATHTVTSDTPGLFDSGFLTQNQTFSFKFNTVGTFGYHCNIHSFMMGTINVVNPTPTTGALYPNSATVNDLALTLTIDGTNFIASTTVHWNSNIYTPTKITPIRLQVTIPATEFMAQGTPQVTVVNPAPGGSSSPALTFTINPTCNMLAVTKKTDDGTCGTFRNALNGAGTSQINIRLPPPSTIRILSTALTVPAGVHINGVCTTTGPGIILDGTGIAGPGLTLIGGAVISGLKIKGFGGPQIQANSGGNQLSCVSASKT